MDADTIKEAMLAGGESWRAARAHCGGPEAPLSKGDYAHSNLSERDLSECDFTESDFYEVDFTRANLKKSVFAAADLTSAKMPQAALYKADLNNAILQEATLSGSDMSSINGAGADFRGANLSGVNFTGADLRGADFSHADLTGANLSRANITGAKFHFAQMSDVNVTHIVYGDYREMMGLYYGVRGIDLIYGNAIYLRDAKDQDYIDTLHQVLLDKKPGFLRTLELFLFKSWGLIDHGRSLLKVAFYAFIIATFYGLIYLMDMVYGWEIMDYSNSAKTWFTPFYYSVVTYTTLGFGDVTADSLFGEIFVISEVIFGYFTLGLLLAILANTIARRS